MAAIAAVLFTCLEAGAHLIGTDSVCGPSRVLVEKVFRRFGVQSDFVDTTHLENIIAALRPETRVLYIETPENPTIRITDIEGCAEIARQHELLLFVDNTFATPVWQRPLELGADIVVRCMRKFLNGHADVVAGIIVTSTRQQRDAVRQVLSHHGGCIDPHQAWLVHRGRKTLGLRLSQAQKSARAISEMLHEHPAVEWVGYPGAPDHSQSRLAAKQRDGAGALLCCGVRGGIDAGRRLMERVEQDTGASFRQAHKCLSFARLAGARDIETGASSTIASEMASISRPTLPIRTERRTPEWGQETVCRKTGPCRDPISCNPCPDPPSSSAFGILEIADQEDEEYQEANQQQVLEPLGFEDVDVGVGFHGIGLFRSSYWPPSRLEDARLALAREPL